MKTLALAPPTVTRGGRTPMLLDAVGLAGAGLGAILTMGVSDSGDTLEGTGDVADGGGFFCGKRGIVLALEGAPAAGNAEGFGGSGTEDGFEMLGIGLVTAVDQAGGILGTGASSNWSEAVRGLVVAAEMLGRGAGMILEEAGLSGLGGRLMRNVSRLDALGSVPVLAESAMVMPFYSYFGKCSMAKFVIVTYL